MLAILTGIPGTGKTTVASRALGILSNEGINYKIVNYGDIMLEIAMSRNLVEDRDDMRKLNPEQQREIQKLAAKRISEIKGNVIVDTHCTISTPKGYLPGLPEWVLKILMPQYILLIEARPDEIAQRRMKDKTRRRDMEMEREISLHQEINRSIATAYAMLTGATVKIIYNPQGMLEKAAEEMARILRY
ncbi:MAG: adenylate kinase [Candidatus Altiarchaeales archaeon]|nr:MAG: adenylate kinase [Candidatus Altiarchaeales archaeon]HDO82466.1 adenylate kinase [Candidatus Altiarchaeales archaeon]HEX55115.1 adenylate kinase [Candidatus Altiarchaeales archaeon]